MLVHPRPLILAAHPVALALVLLPTLLSVPEEAMARAARIARPAAVVYVGKRGRSRGLRYQALGRGRSFWLTRTSKTPTAVQCTADGRWVTYVEDGKVYARRLTRRGKPLLLHTLPKSLGQLHQHQLRAFIHNSPSGRHVALPDPKGVRVYDLKTKTSLLIKPPTTHGNTKKVRVIHPARWLPGHDSLVYLTQSGEKGPGEIKARVFDLIQGRHTLWFPVLTHPVDEVEGYDAAWNRASTRVALSLAVRRGQKRFTRLKIFSVNPYKELRLPRRLRVGRLHGFDPRLGDVVFTARLGRSTAKVWSYSFTRKRRKLLDIGYLGAGRMVLGYYPSRRTALIAAPLRGKCRGRAKLFKASVRFRQGSLVRWARWSEIVATDPTAAWFIFRSGSTCTHKKPVLYLMQADGNGLLRDLPARYRALRKIAPANAALCPRPATRGRRRRRRRRRRR
jgi:hypothetical protein